MSSNKNTIYYTHTDEAPALATKSFLPIVKAFTTPADINIVVKDISLAGRILANFPENLTADQKVSDALTELGELTADPHANIIKLPNISASIPQLKTAIKELKAKGFNIPDFPEEPSTKEEKDLRQRYAKVLGSAVNPVLREGNSDRRVAAPVKAFAKKNPHSMGEWTKDSKSHVAHMQGDDFFANEKSHIMTEDTAVQIQFTSKSGKTTTLKEKVALLKDEVIDASFMNATKLCEYFEREITDAKSSGLLLSLHLKATMMKISDPIMFGHAVKVYFKDVFSKHEKVFDEVGVNPKNGLGDLFAKIQKLPADLQEQINNDINEAYKTRPKLAMVNSDKGITNLHVPSDVIIDASMPAAIRSSGKMWGADGQLHDTKALIPDRSYARVFQETIRFCQEHGAFDVTTMGNVCNVGLMAKKAEEYGSHDKTFEIAEAGKVQVIDGEGNTLIEHEVGEGDIWRMCQTKDVSIKDWVKLAVTRSKSTGNPAVFWLDKDRAHDRSLISKVDTYLKDHDLSGVELKILSPLEATKYTLERVKKGQDTISVTGNVLRDYLTDLFPILELGTSAKMLSIVPLLAGGGLYETGAGGSAPKHVQQFVKENHLRWDSLGEFLALSVSLEDLGEKSENKKATVIAKALDEANAKFLSENKSPSRKVKELDNRGSHFYLAMYWSQALAQQSESPELQKLFAPLAENLTANEKKIIDELNSIQGGAVDLDGYYFADQQKASSAMRPSSTFNDLLKTYL